MKKLVLILVIFVFAMAFAACSQEVEKKTGGVVRKVDAAEKMITIQRKQKQIKLNVTEESKFFDSDGKEIRLDELKAGDKVKAVFKVRKKGPRNILKLTVLRPGLAKTAAGGMQVKPVDPTKKAAPDGKDEDKDDPAE
jgi:Cu/Ag efflux protein CusF